MNPHILLLTILFLISSRGRVGAEEEIRRSQVDSGRSRIPIEGPLSFQVLPELQVGGLGPGPEQFGDVETVEVDPSGRFYVIDNRKRRLTLWSARGRLVEGVEPGDVEGKKCPPLGFLRAVATGHPLDEDRHGHLLILDQEAGRQPEFRIVRRQDGPGSSWKQLYHTHFVGRPHDLTLDRRGRIFIAQTRGALEALLPSGQSRDPSFGHDGVLLLTDVEGLAVGTLKAIDTDFTGNLYVTDQENGRVLKIDPRGTTVQVFGSRGPGESQLGHQAEGVAVDGRGNVYIRDEARHRLVVYDPRGEFLTSLGERGFGPHQQEDADEFAIDKLRGVLHLADRLNYRVSLHRLEDTHLRARTVKNAHPRSPVVAPIWIAGGERGDRPGHEFDEPNELSFDHDGNLWCGDIKNFRVQIFDREGNFLRTLGSEGSADHQFARPESGKSGPEAIQPGLHGLVYVVDRGGAKINVYHGRLFEFAFAIRHELLRDPTGLVIDRAGQLYVACQETNRVFRMSWNGKLLQAFQHRIEDRDILLKTETLALDEKRDRLFASSEEASRVEVFRLSTGEHLGHHVAGVQTGGLPVPGHIVDDVEGVSTDSHLDWLLLSDEDNGRFLVHDLADERLFDADADFACLGAFGRPGTGPGEFISADGVTIDSKLGLVAVADQGNFRIQVFRIEDIRKVLREPSTRPSLSTGTR